MTKLTSHTIKTAPEESRAMMRAGQENFGFIPGLHAVLAASPVAYEAYNKLHELFMNSSFDDEEKTVVWMAINVEHRCHYCVPAHTGIAYSMGVSEDIVNALRDNTPLTSPKLEALRTFTLQVVRERGHVSDSQLSDFRAAGFSEAHILEVLLGAAQKLMSNYTNHLAETPVDSVFEKFAWTPTDAG